LHASLGRRQHNVADRIGKADVRLGVPPEIVRLEIGV